MGPTKWVFVNYTLWQIDTNDSRDNLSSLLIGWFGACFVRLFYAGAMEGQMPEILTMIQVKRMTPTPAVLFMAFLSLMYLGSSNIYALISYVGFATWVSFTMKLLHFLVCLCLMKWRRSREVMVSIVWQCEMIMIVYPNHSCNLCNNSTSILSSFLLAWLWYVYPGCDGSTLNFHDLSGSTSSGLSSTSSLPSSSPLSPWLLHLLKLVCQSKPMPSYSFNVSNIL